MSGAPNPPRSYGFVRVVQLHLDRLPAHIRCIMYVLRFLKKIGGQRYGYVGEHVQKLGQYYHFHDR